MYHYKMYGEKIMENNDEKSEDRRLGFFNNNDDKNYIGDERIRPYLSYKKENSYCIYCSNIADSREHLPPRVFIDTPNKNEWNIVPACKTCNNGYSEDEQLVACAIEYILAMVYYDGEIQRDKVKNTFKKRPRMLEKIQLLCKIEGGNLVIDNTIIESIKNVFFKIGQGHFMYDCSTFLDDNATISIAFEPQLTQKELDEFNSPIICNCLPEIGSRASSQICLNINANEMVILWNIIDDKNYRYLISNDGILRIVVREFLYIEIIQ